MASQSSAESDLPSIVTPTKGCRSPSITEMTITVLAADCADNPGTEARNTPTTVQTSNAYLKRHPKALRADRAGLNAREFAAKKRVIVSFRKAAHWNEKKPS